MPSTLFPQTSTWLTGYQPPSLICSNNFGVRRIYWFHDWSDKGMCSLITSSNSLHLQKNLPDPEHFLSFPHLPSASDPYPLAKEFVVCTVNPRLPQVGVQERRKGGNGRGKQFFLSVSTQLFPPPPVWSSNPPLWLGAVAALGHLEVPICGLVHVALRRKCPWLWFHGVPLLSDYKRIALSGERCRGALWAEGMLAGCQNRCLHSKWLGGTVQCRYLPIALIWPRWCSRRCHPLWSWPCLPCQGNSQAQRIFWVPG